MIFGFYTGVRLGDLAMSTWQNLDLSQKELRSSSRQTGRQVVISLADPLLHHIAQTPASDDPKQPLHPRAYDIAQRHGWSGALSNQFADMLVEAGLATARNHKAKDGERMGRATWRTLSEISFHSLRHTAVSLLKNTGVSDAVA